MNFLVHSLRFTRDRMQFVVAEIEGGLLFQKATLGSAERDHVAHTLSCPQKNFSYFGSNDIGYVVVDPCRSTFFYMILSLLTFLKYQCSEFLKAVIRFELHTFVINVFCVKRYEY